MESGQRSFPSFSHTESFMPKEEKLELDKNKQVLTIGIPREANMQENRVALVPEAVGLLVQAGHKVLIETGAGKNAHFPDNEYSEAGGQILQSSSEIYKADIILKISPLNDNEIDLLSSGTTIFSLLNLTTRQKPFFKKLIDKRSTSIAFEFIKDKTGSFPVLQSTSEIVGRTSIFLASEYFSDPKYGKGAMLGGFPGITPTEVVILGAGTVGENAARTAMNMGAQVKVFDNNIYKLRRLQEKLNSKIFTSIFQAKVLHKSLKMADVVIGALHSYEGSIQYLISEDVVREMKTGSIIIDVSIDQGGCFETSHPTKHDDPVFIKHGVTHYCVPNIASRVPRTASYALSNFFAPIILSAGEEGGIENLLKRNYSLSNGAFLYNGILTKRHIGNLYDIPFQDIELLMAAFR
ncbi:MAG: alanine dehydrogenase, partial [Bacteroidales bacterium]|nr:alanine dehydrogenase [Bacteroidales bacterium]